MISDKDYTHLDYLLDFISAIEDIVAKRDFTTLSIRVNRDALQLNLIQIGESAAHISEAFQKKHPEIKWSDIIGMRNVLVHDYIKTDYKRIWTTATHSVPELKQTLEKIIQQEKTHKL